MKLASTISWSVLATLIRLANGFVLIKIVALLAGPLGVALIGQFSDFNSIVMALALGGISSGVIKYTSQYKDNYDELSKIWQTAVWVSITLSIPVIIVLLVFHNWLAQEFLHDVQYGSILVVFAFSLGFYVVNNLLLNILNGLHEIKQFNTLSILNSILGLLITIALVYQYKVYGALLAMVTSQSIALFIIVFFVRNQAWFQLSHFCGKFDKYYFKKLLSFTVMSLTLICVVPLSQMFVRGYLASKTSWNTAGYWQGLQKISDAYLMIVCTALGTYLLPKLARLQTREEIGEELSGSYKLVMPFVIVIAVVIYCLRDFIIQLLFAKSFGAMRDMFFWQLLGDCFKIASYVLAYLMLARVKTKLFMITTIIWGVSFSFLSYLFINVVGADGAVIAFALSYMMYFLLFVFLYRKGWLF